MFSNAKHTFFSWDLDAFQVKCEFDVKKKQKSHLTQEKRDALLGLQPGNHSVCIQSWLPYVIVFEFETPLTM